MSADKEETFTQTFPQWFLSIVLGDYDKFSPRRNSYDWYNFFGLKPFPDKNSRDHNGWEDYSAGEYLVHYLFHALPTLIRALLLPIRALSWGIRNLLRLSSEGLKLQSEKLADGIENEAASHVVEWSGAFLALLVNVLRFGTYILQPIIAPETAYKEARDTHPFLGAFSFAFSTLVYAGLFFPNTIGKPILSGLIGTSNTEWLLSHLASGMETIGMATVAPLLLQIAVGGVVAYFVFSMVERLAAMRAAKEKYSEKMTIPTETETEKEEEKAPYIENQNKTTLKNRQLESTAISYVGRQDSKTH